MMIIQNVINASIFIIRRLRAFIKFIIAYRFSISFTFSWCWG